MKKVVFLSIAIPALFFAACHKELDQRPISEATTETFYASPTDFLQATTAIYNALRGYPDRLLNLSETRSDNIYGVSEGGVREWEGINSFHKTIAGNPYVTEAWQSNYNGIFRANVLLEQLAQKRSIAGSPALANQLEAQARFLRAFFYFDLVRYFGKVPVITRSVTAPEALQISRSPVDSVYALILSDLQFAGANLPDSVVAADRGRATKWAAKGIQALVHMTRSGPVYSGVEGPTLGKNEWAEALTLLNEIINSNRYGFVTPDSSIFSYTNENNREVIFDVQYNSGSNPILGGSHPWVLVPDTYFQAAGKGTQGGLTGRQVSLDLLNTSYEPNDVRRAFNINTKRYFYNNLPIDYFFFKKYVDVSRAPNTDRRTDWPINFIVLRYTDVLMMKAECILNGAPGPMSDVVNIVNMVRSRAGVSTVSGVTLPQLMEERRREFAGEGLRWHDLVRSGLVETVMNNWIRKEDASKTMNLFQKEYILYPVPQYETDIQPGLYPQNPGY